MDKTVDVKTKSREYFNSTAANYDESHDGKFVNVMYKEIIKRVTDINPESILDVGCGTGNVLKLLAKNKKFKLSGVDLSPNMIEEAKKHLNNEAELKVGDAEKLPWDDNKFDLIICNASFHHYPHAEKVLLEMKRVLRENGTLILGDPTAPGMIRNILNIFIKFSNSGDYRIYNKKEIEKLLNKCGFKTYNWFKPDHKTFIINAEA